MSCPFHNTDDGTPAARGEAVVKSEAAQLERSVDGLFRLKEGGVAPPDASVQIAPGALESSNVNTAEAMVNMIELSRQFDLQVRTMRTAEENARSSATLVRSISVSVGRMPRCSSASR